uniref:IS66 family transposase n=1 Tax=Comamonas sp. 7D-2 TaxID=1232667 RepID=UPI0002D14308|nr:IS66 family transposase [Comamonas sp. 7D-2]AGJ70657.1 Tra [Comamonas sp. 7D-2]
MGMMRGMLSMRDLKAQDLQGLSPETVTALAAQMLERIEQQAQEIDLQRRDLEVKQKLIERKDRDIAWRDAKLEKVNFELARLKRWKFGAKSEAMTAEQRQMFQDTLLEDEADLEAQLAALQAALPKTLSAPKTPRRRPRRQALPDHLRRVEHRHEPEDTNCTTPQCGQPMTRVGEDISERLDIVPAEFFVHRHIYGKWACRCCQRQGIERLVQEPADAQIIDGGIAASGLVAHTLISRFVDHLPYYRQEAINARSGVHTPRSTLASQSGRAGAAMEPLYEAHKRFVLSCPVVHADETPVAMLDPGAGKTKRAYIWAYARGELDGQRGVIYEFCLGRGSQYPVAFLGGAQGPPGSPIDEQAAWSGTLVCDQYAGYDRVLDRRVYPQRIAANCVAHARRKFDELVGTSEVAKETIKRIGWIYHVEGQFEGMDAQQRLVARDQLTRPLWKELHVWLKLERGRVPDGGSIAGAIDYSLNSWTALTRHLEDGAVPIDNNFIERQIKPWAMGRKAWLFCGSELAGQRAAIVMSLVQSAKLNGHDPWAYLRDVLERLPSHPNSRIDELLPHRWKKPDA